MKGFQSLLGLKRTPSNVASGSFAVSDVTFSLLLSRSQRVGVRLAMQDQTLSMPDTGQGDILFEGWMKCRDPVRSRDKFKRSVSLSGSPGRTNPKEVTAPDT